MWLLIIFFSQMFIVLMQNKKQKYIGFKKTIPKPHCEIRAYFSLMEINAMIKNFFSRPYVISLQSSFGFPQK